MKLVIPLGNIEIDISEHVTETKRGLRAKESLSGALLEARCAKQREIADMFNLAVCTSAQKLFDRYGQR